jgi:hypothetical protein
VLPPGSSPFPSITIGHFSFSINGDTIVPTFRGIPWVLLVQWMKCPYTDAWVQGCVRTWWRPNLNGQSARLRSNCWIILVFDILMMIVDDSIGSTHIHWVDFPPLFRDETYAEVWNSEMSESYCSCSVIKVQILWSQCVRCRKISPRHA